jgi:flagellar assembly protein FliH
MSVKHLLEDFGDFEAEQLVMSDQALQEQRLEAFEGGYQAGWDDASKALAEDQAHIGAELGRNLQDLSFTLHEAQTAIIRNLEPLFDAILKTVLPSAVQNSMDVRVIEQLTALAREIGGGTVVISVAPEQAPRIEALLAAETGLNVSVQPDPSLGNGQAFLRIGTRERMIDLDTALDEIRQRISAFFETGREATKHG